MNHFWYAAEWLAVAVIQAWVLAALLLRLRLAGPLTKAVFHELRPFYWPANLLGYLCEVARNGEPLHLMHFVTFGGAVLLWWLLKDSGGDDDRWKKRRKRLAEKVAEVAGRLTVVPAGAEA